MEVSALAQGLLELGEGAGLDGGRVPEVAGQGVEVDVVEPGAGIGLTELLGQGVEVGDVLEDAGSVAEAETLPLAELLGAAPVLTGTQGLQVRPQPGEGLGRSGAERLADSSMSSRCSSVIS